VQLGSCRSFLRLEVVNRGTLSFETCVPDVKHKSRKCVPKWLWYQRLRAVLWGGRVRRAGGGSGVDGIECEGLSEGARPIVRTSGKGTLDTLDHCFA